MIIAVEEQKNFRFICFILCLIAGGFPLIVYGANDVDGDGIFDNRDNCIEVANPNQYDTDEDGYGNFCDGDLNNDNITGTVDLALYKRAFGSHLGDANYNPNADFNSDGIINTFDLALFKMFFQKPPGPSAKLGGTEYFVRPDGGNLGQCDGLSNVAYNININNRQCAVSHLFELLDPQSKQAIIQGGDIINIMNHADGTTAEYEMGMHAQYVSGDCYSSYNYDCHMPSIPSGTASNPTIIRGQGWGNSCDSPPVLWGSGRSSRIITLNGSQHVELSCLTLTDHLGCIGAHAYPDSALICDRSEPYNKPFADTGIYMVDASHILLKDIRIEGLGTGILSGRLGWRYWYKYQLQFRDRFIY